jgi:hypothetical protein
MLHAMFRSVLGDATENRKAAVDGGVDRHQITGLEVRQDPLARRCQRYQVSPDVPLDAQSDIEKGLSSARPRAEAREHRLQV